MPQFCSLCDLTHDLKLIIKGMHEDGIALSKIQALLEQETGQQISESALYRHVYFCLKAQALVPLGIDTTEPPHRVEHAVFPFYDFFKEAWTEIDPAPFIDNWHIKDLCEIFEAMMKGEIKNRKLVINMPPRMGKTNLISVAFVAWAWTINPSLKFIYASYKGDVSGEQSRLCRKLIESEWYQERWGNLFDLEKDQSTKERFANTKHGARISTSLQTDITAFGCDIFVLDDPNGIRDKDVDFERAQTYFETVCPSRMNPQGLNIRIVVQQRVSSKDITGFIQKTDTKGLWQHFVLPLEFDPELNTQVVSTTGKIWKDRRIQEGEILWPQFFKEEIIEELKSLPSYAGQYQQRPTAKAGNFFKRKDFLVYDHNLLDDHAGFVLLANHIDVKPLQERHEAACIVLSLYTYKNRNRMVMMGAWTGSVTMEENLQQIVRMAHDCRDNGTFEINDGPLVWKEVKAHYFDQNNKPIDPEKIKLKRRRKDRILPEPIYTVEKKPWFDQPPYRSKVITTSSNIVAEDLWRQGKMVRPHFRIHPFAAKDMLGKRPISQEEIDAFVKRFMGEAEYLFLAPAHLYPYLTDFLDMITSYPDEGAHALGQALINAMIYCWVTGKIKVPWAVGDLLRSGTFKDADHWEKQTDMTKLHELTHQAFTYIKLNPKIQD
ncbi:hypothetical protein Cva_01713 [Caedimonas varicaedens]|uniref:Terminase-like family protein n=1 Tax=Caedimonas varicaedens TaxID=1629334 RepID=A0A0K8MET9_9PROT|nr:hypothetical protein Cva_01713 [Caedimonas varicaedens]